MLFRHREGGPFAQSSRDKRRAAGLTSGERDADYYDARIRWACPTGLCPEVTTWAHEHPDLYTFWPHGGESKPALARAAQLEYRSGIESLFAGLKLNGLGTLHMRPLWARDAEAEFLLGFHMLLITARRVAHETGAYNTLLGEYRQLGLDRGGHIPDRSIVDSLHRQRPAELQWDWPGRRRAGNLLLPQAATAA